MFKTILIGIILCIPSIAHNQTLIHYNDRYFISKQVMLIEKVGYRPYNKVINQKQLKCLTDNVYFEAGNDTESAKIAVALVTLNRLKHEYFPDTICDVVYQRTKWKCQFTWVCKGLRRVYYRNTYNESKKIAEYVIMNYDHIEDNTKGATFFHHRRIHNPFIRIGARRTASIGKHIFYKL